MIHPVGDLVAEPAKAPVTYADGGCVFFYRFPEDGNAAPAPDPPFADADSVVLALRAHLADGDAWMRSSDDGRNVVVIAVPDVHRRIDGRLKAVRSGRVGPGSTPRPGRDPTRSR